MLLCVYEYILMLSPPCAQFLSSDSLTPTNLDSYTTLSYYYVVTIKYHSIKISIYSIVSLILEYVHTVSYALEKGDQKQGSKQSEGLKW